MIVVVPETSTSTWAAVQFVKALAAGDKTKAWTLLDEPCADEFGDMILGPDFEEQVENGAGLNLTAALEGWLAVRIAGEVVGEGVEEVTFVVADSLDDVESAIEDATSEWPIRLRLTDAGWRVVEFTGSRGDVAQ